MAGYSGTPLPKKLGFEEGQRVGLAGAPTDFAETLGSLPEGVELTDLAGPVDAAVCFATEAADLEEQFHLAMSRIPSTGSIWCAWPKKASKVPTDITEDRLRELFLPTGLVDTKVCAIDETWSGLRFMVRKELRADWPDPS